MWARTSCRLAAGHEVINISRATRTLSPSRAWRSVQQVNADRAAEDAQGVFGQRVCDLEPDLVMDMICLASQGAADR